jgi:adenylate cyclase
VTVLASWRQRLARAIERGDARLGLGVGLVLSLLSAWAFALPLQIPRQLDDAVLDAAFKLRPAIREAPEILLVDMNDQTFQAFSWPIKRDLHARVTTALDRLGARGIVFDVQFRSTLSQAGEYDPATGGYVLTPEDLQLRRAIATSGNVVLAYHLEMSDPLAPAVRARFPAILSVLRERFTAGAGEVASRAGLDPQILALEFTAVRKEAAAALVAEMIDREPGLAFAAVRERLLPGDPARTHPDALRIVHYAYWTERGRVEVERKSCAVRVDGRPRASKDVHGILPPFYPFLEAARAAAPANADADRDGVLRRPPACLWLRGRPHFYLGLVGAFPAIAPAGIEAAVRPEGVTLWAGGSEVAVLPTDAEGRLLINWAGNRHRSRHTPEPYFAHVPFHKLLEYYDARYDLLDQNCRRTFGTISEELGEPYHPEYVALSDRLKRILEGKEDAPKAEVGRVEAELDRHRREALAHLDREIEGIEKALPTLKSQRAKENSLKVLSELRQRADGIRPAYELEEKLRPLVQGKVCWIGSASTASGDLHSTPLGASTPGMDALASVANMAITRQPLRRAPGWAVLVYLVAVGVLVSLAVTQGRTTSSALMALGLVAVAGVVYALLFVKASLLLSGAGPVTTAIFAFAGVTAFKELVTERSRRKLEKELEKNTSPELVEILMEHPEFLREPRKMTGTFFFSDIKSFTSISEKMTPEVLVPFINRYLDRTTQSLKRHRAYLDKYIGDGIMALFGVPVASDDHARNACRAALENQALLATLNDEFEREGLPRIKTRIGINSGGVIAGYVGAADRSDYTVLGDAVNLASRLEGANKEYGTAIMVSEFTQRLVASEFVFRELDRIRVVGKENAVGIYELAAPAGAPSPFPPGFLDAYGAALARFRGRKWTEAIEGFEKALALRPGDRPSEVYVARAQTFLVTPPPPDWEGVFELSSK